MSLIIANKAIQIASCSKNTKYEIMAVQTPQYY